MSGMKGKLAEILLMGAIMGSVNSGGINRDEAAINNKDNYKGKGFSGGQSKMREFVIDGFIIKATDLKMAKKKYAAMKKIK